MDQKKSHEIEQSIAEIRDVIPRMWRQIYLGCLEQGFSPRQAFSLLQTHILSQNGVKPPDNDKDDNKDIC
jgi:hypothetical protein